MGQPVQLVHVVKPANQVPMVEMVPKVQPVLQVPQVQSVIQVPMLKLIWSNLKLWLPTCSDLLLNLLKLQNAEIWNETKKFVKLATLHRPQVTMKPGVPDLMPTTTLHGAPTTLSTTLLDTMPLANNTALDLGAPNTVATTTLALLGLLKLNLPIKMSDL